MDDEFIRNACWSLMNILKCISSTRTNLSNLRERSSSLENDLVDRVDHTLLTPDQLTETFQSALNFINHDDQEIVICSCNILKYILTHGQNR